MGENEKDEDQVVTALRATLKFQECLFGTADVLKKWCGQRFTADRWLDENEREWYVLDRICRSRPWATNKDTAFKYTFREFTDQMRRAEGSWIGDAVVPVESKRSADAPCDVLAHLHFPLTYPPPHRVVLFTPEFGSHASFDIESWSYMEPEDQVDIWAVCWQGWTNFDEMIQEVTKRVLSFADGCNTVWVGFGMGAIVAYEVLKRLEQELQTPNVPVGLVVVNCPAPHDCRSYRPEKMSQWKELLAGPEVTDVRRARIAADLATMRSYSFRHQNSRCANIPLTVACHEGDEFLTEVAAKEWASYAASDKFQVVLLDQDGDMDEYIQGHRYSLNIDPELRSEISEMIQKYDRWIQDGVMPDIGPTDNPLPTEVDCVVVGAGWNGAYMAHTLAADGKTVAILDRHSTVGGVWDIHGNDYSRVNTSEIGYRYVDRGALGLRVNEDHSPKLDILRDIHWTCAQHNKGRIHCNIDVTKVEKQPDDTWHVHTKHLKTGHVSKVHAKAVSLHVNRRIGKKRWIEWDGREHFRGDVFYGYGNEMKTLKIDFWNKKVLIIGAGAFAFENVRTAIEWGARHVTLLGRRDGTTCPKWIDMLSFLRPLDEHLNTNKVGNMLSFECWQKCYKDAGLKMPKHWEEGLLKPNNHTVSVSDVAFIAGYHGMFELKVGQIKCYREDGMGVELVDGSHIDCNMVVKCTGFHLNDDVPLMTGLEKMQPYGLMDLNLNYGAEPLLDGGQFGGAKGGTDIEMDLTGVTAEDWQAGMAAFPKMGFNPNFLEPYGNPFGSGQGGPAVFQAKYFSYLVHHKEEQKALLEASGKAPMNVVNLWGSQIPQYQGLIVARLLCALGKLHGKSAQ